MPIIDWPTIDVLNTVINDFEIDPDQFVARKFMPATNVESEDIKWDVKGAVSGMTAPYQMGAAMKSVKFIKLRTVRMGTAYWGETSELNEEDLIRIRKPGTLSQRAGRILLQYKLDQLNVRLETRMEWLRWQAMQGNLDLVEDGIVRHIDYGIPAAQKIDLTAGGAPAPWTDKVNTDPITQLQDWTLLFRGTGCSKPTVYMNKKTALLLVQNKTVRDLVRQSTVVQKLNIGNLSELLLPLLNDYDGFFLYDDGYFDDAGTFNPFIPDNIVIIKGRGPSGEPFGDLATTITVRNGGIDNPRGGKFTMLKEEIGPEYEIQRVMVGAGFHGLPRIYHPNWLIKVKVG